MRRFTAALLLAAGFLLLSGCTLSIYNNYRDIESLRIVRVLGIDLTENGVLLSAATGEDASERSPLRLTGEGETLAEAMRSLEDSTDSGSLFLSGAGAIVLGADAAGDISRWLDAIARSRELRLDTELFVLRRGAAAELIAGEDAPEDVFSALDALSMRLRETGGAPSPNCARVSQALTASGAALAAAIELEEGPEGKYTPVPAGYAALTRGGFAGWLDGDAALGAGLFLGGVGMETLTLPGGMVAELAGVELKLVPLWREDGSLARLDIELDVRGSIIEAPPGCSLASREDWDALGEALAGEVCAWVEAALEESRSLGADILGLGERLSSRWPLRFAALSGRWEATLRSLDFGVSGEGKLLNAREFVSSPYGEASP